MNLKKSNTEKTTAKVLKNAAKMMNDENGNIRFTKFMETIARISSKGNRTFVLGDFVESMRE